MALNKTEQPTQKKIKDAVQKGQTFKSKDIVIACLIILGVNYIVTFDFVKEMAGVWIQSLTDGFNDSFELYFKKIFILALKIILPFILLCICCTMLPSLLQTGFAIATKVFRLNFKALNPVSGFKKIFSLRTVKDFFKTILYLGVFVIVAIVLWHRNKYTLFLQLSASPQQMIFFWGEILNQLVKTCLAGMLLIMILDSFAEYFLYIKELKMDKQEVKLERKDQDGNPEIKSKRRHLHMEILDEQTKLDISNSKLIIANPNHIAIGIYFNVEIVPIPFISVLETNNSALAVRKYAKDIGVPVLEDIALARRIYSSHTRYSFINLDELDAVLRLLIWLEQVDNGWAESENTELINNEGTNENDVDNERNL